MRLALRQILQRRGAVLIIVLWGLVAMSIILTNFAVLVRTHLRLAANFAEDSELTRIAEAGIETAIIILKNADTSAATNAPDLWADDEEELKEIAVGDGKFSLVRYRTTGEVTDTIFGLEDEAAKLNLRTATKEELQALPRMKPEMVDALIDWRDEDSNAQPQGAEAEYYAGLKPPYATKNRQLDTVEELLLVKGFDASVLYGEDWNHNGMLDPNEKDGKNSLPPDDENAVLDRGLLPYLTVYSEDQEKSASKAPRTDINSAEANALKAGIQGLTDDEAKAIVAYRDAQKFENLGDLLKVTKAQEKPVGKDDKKPAEEKKDTASEAAHNSGSSSSAGRRGSRKRGEKKAEVKKDETPAASTGEKIFTKDRLKQIIDSCKIGSEETKAGRININTAPAPVLRTLPKVTQEIADAIVDAREKQKKKFANIAELLDIPGVTEEIFTGLSNKVTVRAYQFRADSRATLQNVTARERIVAVLDRSGPAVKIRYWNESK
ncbi:type II secretion system protein GspK [soil metagenome]